METNDEYIPANSDTLNNLTTIDGAISVSNRKRLVKKITFLCLSILSLLGIILYLALPVFQTSNMKVDGLINFGTSDFISLSDLDSYCPLGFMNVKEKEEKALSSSKPFFRSVSIESNGLTAHATVVEEKPVGKYGSDTYFSSGDKASDILSKVSSLPLENVSIEKIRENIGEEITSSLPTVHYPKGITHSDENITLAMTGLVSVPYYALNEISDIQYINDGNDAKWNNVLSFVIKDDDKCFLIKEVLTEMLSTFFTEKNTPLAVAKSCESYLAKHPEIGKKDFTFQDDGEVISAYEFTLTKTDDLVIISHESEAD